jgi:hypothetical protein
MDYQMCAYEVRLSKYGWVIGVAIKYESEN